MWYESILDTIGNTPLVRLQHVTEGLSPIILGKVEYFNPGQSAKDRVAKRMIQKAEQAGKITPGGTIIEVTSGNTGVGVALTATQMGYRCLFVMSDKISKEKVNLLRALGAEVVLCPSKVLPEHPDSVYSTAQRLEAEIPNSAYLNQYDNTANLESHYASTGPEIWRQTEGRITHFVSSMGTCGTMCGTSRFLKEQNPAIVCVGVDAFGSTLKAAHATGKADQAEIYPYLTEALGKDFMPANMDRTVIDHVIQVHDRDSALMARRMAREESLMVGWSCGAAVVAALQVAKTLEPTDLMVVMLHDHGSRYMGKIFNDEWMVQQGFLTPEEAGLVPA